MSLEVKVCTFSAVKVVAFFSWEHCGSPFRLRHRLPALIDGGRWCCRKGRPLLSSRKVAGEPYLGRDVVMRPGDFRR